MMEHRAKRSRWMRWGALALCGVLAGLICFAATERAPTAAPAAAEAPRTLYVVGYSHLDTQWRWSFAETIEYFLPETVDRNVEAFQKYPNYVLNFTGASRYQLIQEYFPERYQTVRDWVKRGRWFPAGNQWEECDVLSPSSESILRQILHGHRYFLREFGTESTEFMLPDSFGFPASLPSLLAHAGLRGFSTQKLTWNPVVPIPFNVGRWQGVDGKGVVAALRGGNYAGVHRVQISRNEAWAERLDDNGKNGAPKIDFAYNGTGDIGGAPHAVSLTNVEVSLSDPGPVQIKTGRADRMFRELDEQHAAKLPSYTGELLLTEHSAGSLTSQAFIKRQNRMNELLADAAERASVAAELLGVSPYPTAQFEQAWQLVLRGQFHDIITGTSVPKAYEYSWNDEFIAQNQFIYGLTDAVAAISRELDTEGSGVPVVVYNPLSIAREDLVELKLPTELRAAKAITAVGPEGERLVTQRIVGSDGQPALLFAPSVPALSWSVYSLQPSTTRPGQPSLIISRRELGNERYLLRINRDGDIESLYDRQANRELLTSPIRLTYQTEYPSEFPAWNMDWLDRKQEPNGYVQGEPKIAVVEQGPLRATLRIEREQGGSLFADTLRLHAGSNADRIEFQERIDWKGSACSLKASFPFTVKNPRATYSWGLGTVLRGNNHPHQYEVPTHGFIDLTHPDASYGVTLLTGSKYGSDKPTDGTIRLTLLYTPGTTEPYHEQGTQDWGRHDIAYALVGHAGALDQREASWQAQRFEQPVLAFAVPKHTGALGKRWALLEASGNQIAVQAVKKAEDGRGYVFRFQELAGKAGRLKIKMARPLVDVWELNGVEQRLGSLPRDGDTLALEFGPNQLRTLGLSFAPHPTAVAATNQPLIIPYDLDAVSFNRNRRDGDNDGRGTTYPAELWPKQLEAGTTRFELGSPEDGQPNALVTRGQTLPLPRGFKRVHLLATSTAERHPVRLFVGHRAFDFELGPDHGYVGQWDNRLFSGNVEVLTASVDNDVLGLAPAFLHTDRIAWAVSHRHEPIRGDTPYAYGYLHSYSFPIAPDDVSLKLPNDKNGRVFAITLSRDEQGAVNPLSELWPQLGRDARFRERFGNPTLSRKFR